MQMSLVWARENDFGKVVTLLLNSLKCPKTCPFKVKNVDLVCDKSLEMIKSQAITVVD